MNSNSPSSRVHTSQPGIHHQLASQVEKHLRKKWLQPVNQPTLDAFTAVAKIVSGDGRKLVIDSGCGTGDSTRLIAARHKESWVVAIDQSAARLGKAVIGPLPQTEGQIIWVRAELAGFWKLALAAGWHLHAHYLLYPNPWPKPGHLQRRWHGHPVFPTLLRLGGQLELRTNWNIYAEEFALAVNVASGYPARTGAVNDLDITTAFERKYRFSGHDLWSVKTPDLSADLSC
jgi:tRNA (guanine-N7-)-methyltransferase